MMRRLAMFLSLLLAVSRLARAQNADNPHGPIRDACASCHRSGSWKDVRISPEFRHAERTFPLQGAHARVTCLTCHKTLDFAKTPATCATCHSDVHKGELGNDCSRCHTTRSFIDRASMQQAHSQTRFPLRGAHATVRCEACHAVTSAGPGQFVNKPTTCAGCHMKDFRATTSPSHEGARFSQDCVSCHTIATWTSAKFDHSKTRFPLTGRHVGSTCAACHADKVFAGKSTTCVTCHQRDFDASVSPRHRDGFPRDCTSCHTTQAWKGGATFDHGATAFALTGAHRATLCSACHGDQVFKGKVTTCVGCHQQAFTASARPPHASLGFATTCLSCHTTAAWQGGTFDHSKTRFPLSGGHAAASCNACHADGTFRGKSMTCASCHLADYNTAKVPPHAASGFPTDCAACHRGTVTWKGAVFDHAKTRFPLTGGHAAASCSGCHGDGVFRGKPTTCVSCHQANYNATTNPNHIVNRFATTCEGCHTTVTWRGAFDHSTTRFPLTAGHSAATCNDCHADGVYKGRSMACASCHQADFTATTNPHHAQAGFATTCESCHTTARWPGVPYNHNATSFPLTGAHVATLCSACHADKVYNNKPTACVSCHLTNYNNTISPKHTTTGYGTDCASCHATTQWLGATFDHSKSAFPLTGAHVATPCTACHVNGVYKGTPTTCVSCHQTVYNNSSNPHHLQAGFATTCQTCHTTTVWTGAPYNHNATSFPLTGAHVVAMCIDCHADKVYNNKSTLCVSCHQTDYNNTTNPKHSTVGYSTDCVSCHTTIQWLGAIFDHSKTAFPLTGAHLATICTDCHVNGVYKGTPTTCVSCHQTDYNNSTNPHHLQAGFATTCQTCHTTTVWTGAPYNHSLTKFPLTGKHAAVMCIDCHASKVYKGLNMTCVSCHLTDYNNTTNPKHTTVGYGTDCASCHSSTTTWLGAVFNHDGPYFRIYSGKHQGKWTTCADCHTNPANYQVFECILCHEHNNKSKVDADHQGKNGYQYNSAACYSCHARV